MSAHRTVGSQPGNRPMDEALPPDYRGCSDVLRHCNLWLRGQLPNQQTIPAGAREYRESQDAFRESKGYDPYVR